MDNEQAQGVALEALAWLAGNEELCTVFLGASGASVDDLRAGVKDPAFLSAVLDFLTMDDAWVTAFCDATGHPYDAPLQARLALPGADVMHWT